MNIVFALTGDIFSNSRAIRQLDALQFKGVTGYILHLGSPDRPKFYRGFHVIAIPRPAGDGPMFFWNNHKAFSAASEPLSADVYHASDLYCLPALSRKARENNSKLVFDSRELYHHVESTEKKPLSRWFWFRLQRSILPKTDIVFTVSNSIADFLQKDFSIPRPIVVPNVPQIANNAHILDLKDELGIPKNSFVIIHTGNIRTGRHCDILVRALKETDDSVHVVFMGVDETSGQIERLAIELNVDDRVHFKSAVPPSDVVTWTRSADIGVTLLAKTCLNHDFALPNKLFEYLAAGIPVIGSNLREISNLINAYDVGRVTELDPARLGALIQDVVENPDDIERWKRNTASVVNDLNWNSASTIFMDAYDEVL